MAVDEPIAAPSHRWTLDPVSYARRPTRVVMVGSVAVGGSNPIRLQSMTTTDTMNTEATVAQSLRMVEAGCEIVRITAPTVLDAKNLETIKSELMKRGCRVPLVADIHFRPDAAMVAADFVEKVRINPGNFVDGKAFKVREYTDVEYADELKRIEDRFTPLVLKMKRLGRAMRIGTNHGSLSDRIMNRFGDSPLGMVESALEFVRICEKNDYRDIILSMKASNPRVMISAYRLLAQRMAQLGMDYPFHLGVTEAGDGPDGRIKSAAGIGSLLEDGIGDTIRVSLTEDPEFEIPVAREIAERYRRYRSTPAPRSFAPYVPDSLNPTRRAARPIRTGPIELGAGSPIRVVTPVDLAAGAGDRLLAILEDRLKKDAPPEIVEISHDAPDFDSGYQALRERLRFETQRIAYWVAFTSGRVPERVQFRADGFVFRAGDRVNPVEARRLAQIAAGQNAPLVVLAKTPEALLEWMERDGFNGSLVLGLEVGAASEGVHAWRRLSAALARLGSDVPLLLRATDPSPTLAVAIVQGSLICDGLGDAICVTSAPLSRDTLDFAYNLLQACGSRSTKTEFVSCPSCGRTLFDLQSTTERIKSKTGHLKGVKIAIMGCIVNGPGEMADADFGYVGGGPGKINLYVGKTCVEKSIPSEIADGKLIELIKAHGKWVDAPG